MIADTTGVVLAGGRGTRLGGVRKALILKKDGRPILVHTLELFAKVFPYSLIIANEAGVYDSFGAPVTSDPIADRGAPGGLFAALSVATTEWVFLAACDMPALDATVIEALAAKRKGVEAVVPTVEGRPEPLHGFYAASAKNALGELLREGEPSFRNLLDVIPHAKVAIWDLPGGAKQSFANVNTPEDLERLGLTLPATK